MSTRGGMNNKGAPQQASSSRGGKNKGRLRRVLVVDDCVVPRKSLKRMIMKIDSAIVVDTASSGEEGIKLVQKLVETGVHYDVIFMDQDMHNTVEEKEQQLQGDAAVQALRKMNYTFPIVMRTNNCNFESVNQYTTSGADAILPKKTPAVPLKRTLTLAVKSTLEGELSAQRFCEGLILLKDKPEFEHWSIQVRGALTPGPPEFRSLKEDLVHISLGERRAESDKTEYRRLPRGTDGKLSLESKSSWKKTRSQFKGVRSRSRTKNRWKDYPFDILDQDVVERSKSDESVPIKGSSSKAKMKILRSAVTTHEQLERIFSYQYF
ncbi:hypothetical protein AAMO2058_000236300 [Amorphochlora amoebiformis]